MTTLLMAISLQSMQMFREIMRVAWQIIRVLLQIMYMFCIPMRVIRQNIRVICLVSDDGRLAVPIGLGK